MTVKKNSKKAAPKVKPKATKGKKLVRSLKKRPAAKTDRADKAFKVLLRAKQKKMKGGQD